MAHWERARDLVIETFEQAHVEVFGQRVPVKDVQGGSPAAYGAGIAKVFAAAGVPMPPEETKRDEPLHAYVNQGRWVVECDTGCGFSLQVCEAVLFFVCPVHAVWRPIEFPAEREAIEAELVIRPEHPHLGLTKSNWRPPETVDALRAENAIFFFESGQREKWQERYGDFFARIEAAHLKAAAEELEFV